MGCWAVENEEKDKKKGRELGDTENLQGRYLRASADK